MLPFRLIFGLVGLLGLRLRRLVVTGVLRANFGRAPALTVGTAGTLRLTELARHLADLLYGPLAHLHGSLRCLGCHAHDLRRYLGGLARRLHGGTHQLTELPTAPCARGRSRGRRHLSVGHRSDGFAAGLVSCFIRHAS